MLVKEKSGGYTLYFSRVITPMNLGVSYCRTLLTFHQNSFMAKSISYHASKLITSCFHVTFLINHLMVDSYTLLFNHWEFCNLQIIMNHFLQVMTPLGLTGYQLNAITIVLLVQKNVKGIIIKLKYLTLNEINQ